MNLISSGEHPAHSAVGSPLHQCFKGALADPKRVPPYLGCGLGGGQEGPPCLSAWDSAPKGAVSGLAGGPSLVFPDSFSRGIVFFSQNLNSSSLLKTWQGCAPIGSRITWIFCPSPKSSA